MELAGAPTRHPYVLDVAQPDTEAVLAERAAELGVVVEWADQELLDSYQDERHPVGAAVVRATTMLTDVGTVSGPEAAIRNIALFVVGHVHRLRSAAATTMAELTVNYRDSTLSVHRGEHHPGAVRAGDHASSRGS